MKSSKHIDWQKYSERFALSILTDDLRIPCDSIMESESLDSIFNYEGKQIGSEVVELIGDCSHSAIFHILRSDASLWNWLRLPFPIRGLKS